MQQKSLGKLPPASTLTLGGGGLGMVWGETSFEECVATVHAAVTAGINWIDLAPRYGDGKAELVVGEAFSARLPDAAGRMTLYATFVDRARPLFERLVGEGVIGAWGLTGIGHPDTIIKLVGEEPAPSAVQCIANLLDSPGGLKFFDGPARPRAIMAAARANGVAIMGIRAVQAGALTAAIDRPLPEGHPEVRDYERAADFRRLAADLGEDPAILAHRYALSL